MKDRKESEEGEEGGGGAKIGGQECEKMEGRGVREST